MSGMITAVVGTGLVGSMISSNAAKSAADTQANAANQASQNTLTATQQTNAMQQGFFNQNQANQAPYMQTGNLALSALTAGMGLGNPYGGSNNTNPTMTPGVISRPVAAPGSPAGTMVQGGNFTNASGQVVDAAGNPVAASALPTVNAGQASQSQLNNAANSQMTNGVGNFTTTFKPSDLSIDPSYQWRLNQGTAALGASAAASGQLGSGQNLKDITNYAQGAASQEYQAAYDRFMNNQNTAYGRLAGLAGLGQNAAAGVGNNGLQTGANMANTTMSGVNAANNYTTSGAAAQAAGSIGQANAVNGAINNGMNSYMGLQYLNKMPNPTPTPTADPLAGTPTPIAQALISD